MQKKVKIFLGIHGFLIIIWVAYLLAIQMFDVYNFKNQNIVSSRYKKRKHIIQSVRGDILDSKGNLLATTSKYYRLEINRTKVLEKLPAGSSKKSFYTQIATFFEENTRLTKRSLLKKLNYKGKANSIYISKSININELFKIKSFFAKYKMQNCLYIALNHMDRKYTQENFDKRLLGSIKSESDPTKKMVNQIYKLKGFTGIEKSYDSYLTGTYGWEEVYKDASGDFYRTEGLKKKIPVNGNSIQITIDKNIQEIVERQLSDGLEKFEAKNAVAVVMEPSTGKILAMSSASSADKEKSDQEIRLSSNLGVSFLFEPGSTFKSLPIALALENNLYNWDTKIDCSTLITDYGRKITDHERYDKFTLKNLLTHSSNPGISRVIEKVGGENYWKFLKEVGFGRTSGLDLKGENSGKLRHFTKWSAYSLHSLAFGQEISVNAVQLAKVYAAIANNGKMMRPYILEKVISPDGKIVEEFEPEEIRTIASKSTIDTLKMYLQNVVENGTAKGTKFGGISCGGKTGTAEKTYSKNKKDVKYYTSFAGFLPVENPRYVAVIVYDEPSHKYDYASASAVPVFKNIFSEVIQLDYCPIIPETKFAGTNELIIVPNLINKSINEAENILKSNNINYQLIAQNGAKNISEQIPAAGALVVNDQKIIIKAKNTSNNKMKHDDSVMPNFVGLSVREAYSVATKNFISLIASGNGIIEEQHPKSGLKKKFGAICKVVAK